MLALLIEGSWFEWFLLCLLVPVAWKFGKLLVDFFIAVIDYERDRRKK